MGRRSDREAPPVRGARKRNLRSPTGGPRRSGASVERRGPLFSERAEEVAPAQRNRRGTGFASFGQNHSFHGREQQTAEQISDEHRSAERCHRQGDRHLVAVHVFPRAFRRRGLRISVAHDASDLHRRDAPHRGVLRTDHVPRRRRAHGRLVRHAPDPRSAGGPAPRNGARSQHDRILQPRLAHLLGAQRRRVAQDVPGHPGRRGEAPRPLPHRTPELPRLRFERVPRASVDRRQQGQQQQGGTHGGPRQGVAPRPHPTTNPGFAAGVFRCADRHAAAARCLRTERAGAVRGRANERMGEWANGRTNE